MTERPARTASRVYLDKGAISELWRSTDFSSRELLRIRRRLCSRNFTGRPHIVLGPQIVSELASMVRHKQFVDELLFLRQLPERLYLKDIRRRVAAEIATAAGGDGTPWLPTVEADGLLEMATGDPTMWAAERTRLALDKGSFGRTKTAGLTDFLSRNPNRKQQAAAAKDFYSQPRDMVAHWVREQLRRNRELFDLSPDEETWPTPETLPTIWGAAAYHSARDFLVMRDGWKVDENDQTDAWHYAAAMYADQLVLLDRKFRQIADLCPAPKPSPITFSEWAHRLLHAPE